jgi:uncharacterized delta-60 repeat protein
MKTIFTTSLLLCVITASYAQQGSPDAAFGVNGIVKTGIGALIDYSVAGRKVLSLPDGTMFVVTESASRIVMITKKTASNKTDSTYGINGTCSIGMFDATAVMQADNKIIIAGTSSPLNYSSINFADFKLVRIDINGKLDKSFNGTGIQTSDFAALDNAVGAVIQGDGKIVVAGNSGDYFSTKRSFAIARFNSDGSPDNSFGTNGQVISYFGALGQSARAVAVKASGKIILAGTELVQYNADGSVDLSFNGTGEQTVFGRVNSVAIQADGKIVTGGNTNYINAPTVGLVISRYNVDGSYDNSFNGDGVQITKVGAASIVNGSSVLIQPDGKPVLAGYTDGITNYNFALCRYKINGDADSSFGVNGVQVTDIIQHSNDFVNAATIQPDGKLIAIGYTRDSLYNNQSVITRYNTNGTADLSFDGDGILIEGIKQASTFYTCTAVQQDKKIIAAGYAWNGANYDFAIARYKTNGTLDSTFSNDGIQTTDFAAGDDKINAMVLQPDGRIIVVGASGDNFGIARYNMDGTPDVTFDVDGKQSTFFGTPQFANSIALQTDGKLLVGGPGELVRYNINGSQDMNFDGDGKLTTSFSHGYAFNCNTFAIQPDGKIVVAGFINQQYIIVGRFNADGTTDSSFFDAGSHLFPSGGYTTLCSNSMAIQQDGKIVFAGYQQDKRNVVLNANFNIFRLNTDGSLDASFPAELPSPSYGTAVKIQQDGKVITAGYTYDYGHWNFSIVRNNINGSIDNTFGMNGRVITEASAGDDQVAGIAIDDDKLYAVGYGQYPGNKGVVARYLLGIQAGPLAVKLVDFTGVLQNETVPLQWHTTGEQNLAHFIVERSNDGVVFYAFDKVIAKTGAMKNSYTTTDRQPLTGPNFYRLKMVDGNGSFIYSDVIRIDFSGNNFSLAISPNPTKNNLLIKATGKNETAAWQVFNAAGIQLKQAKVYLSGATSFTIDVNSLPAGLYIFKLITASKVFSSTFIKE